MSLLIDHERVHTSTDEVFNSISLSSKLASFDRLFNPTSDAAESISCGSRESLDEYDRPGLQLGLALLSSFVIAHSKLSRVPGTENHRRLSGSEVFYTVAIEYET